MNMHKNKRLHISVFDMVFLVVFLAASLLAEYSMSNCRKTKELFNIENSYVDYTITAPSQEQIQAIKSRDDIDHVTPYVFKTVDCNVTDKNIRSNLFILESVDDIKYTSFSDELLIKKDSHKYENPLYISSDFAANAKLSLGDTVSIALQEKPISFSIQAVFESDHRYVGGTIMALMQGDVVSAIGNDYVISGAFIDSNDITTTNEFLNDYVPLGDLRTRDEFDSDELYQIYLEERESTDFTKTTFYAERYLDELHTRKDNQLKREFGIAVGVFILGLFVTLLSLRHKAQSYIKRDVIKDIHNNYSIEQETDMFKAYFSKILLCYVLLFLVTRLISMYAFHNELVSIINTISLIAVILSVLIVRVINVANLKNEFAIRVKEEKCER